MPDRVPLVEYLVLDPRPRLVVSECVACGARLFGRRNSCPGCMGTDFKSAFVDATGELVTFTIVYQATPGIPVPFVAAVVDCGGTWVSGNVVNTPFDPAVLRMGMKVRLTTVSLGLDEDGIEAVGFGFEPVGEMTEAVA